ncbi:hypothetical protein [Streptomyces sp. NPDC090021]|uniref:hypothetical protein n=1 Tax=Streptomyces sp. NPDC090021 TaxID=3365919 RepID=UPI0037F8C97E
MAGLDDLVRLFGLPPARVSSPDDWAEVESHLGSALPDDFKAFLDSYGTGAICGELVVFHPLGSSPLLERMRKIHESFGQSWRRGSDAYPFRFHPTSGGLISWGYDYSGDEHTAVPGAIAVVDPQGAVVAVYTPGAVAQPQSRVDNENTMRLDPIRSGNGAAEHAAGTRAGR